MIQIASGATMAYPPGWRAIRGDPGTATAALRDARHAFVGYLNLTPRQGGETLANWGSFRTAHNVHEGDRDVVRLATAGGLRFRTGRGACVKDSYVTSTGERYTEIACLVAGHASSVIVGAAPPGTWPQVKALIERSISALTT